MFGFFSYNYLSRLLEYATATIAAIRKNLCFV